MPETLVRERAPSPDEIIKLSLDARKEMQRIMEEFHVTFIPKLAKNIHSMHVLRSEAQRIRDNAYIDRNVDSIRFKKFIKDTAKAVGALDTTLSLCEVFLTKHYHRLHAKLTNDKSKPVLRNSQERVYSSIITNAYEKIRQYISTEIRMKAYLDGQPISSLKVFDLEQFYFPSDPRHIDFYPQTKLGQLQDRFRWLLEGGSTATRTAHHHRDWETIFRTSSAATSRIIGLQQGNLQYHSDLAVVLKKLEQYFSHPTIKVDHRITDILDYIPNTESLSLHPDITKRINRRNLLKKAAKVAVGTPALIAFSKLGIDTSMRVGADLLADFGRSIEELHTHIKNTYNVEVVFGRQVEDKSISYTPLTGLTERKEHLEIITKAFSLYPPDIFTRNGISSIAVVHNLLVDGDRVNGVFSPGQQSVTLDSSSGESTVHHELYHAFDYLTNGFSSEDSQWQNLHTCACQVYEGTYDVFRNGGEGSNTTSSNNWFINDPELGSIEDNPYGKTYPTEDRAVFAQVTMMADTHSRLIQIIANEPDETAGNILKQKYELIKAQYFIFSNGRMNDEYWQALLERRVNSEYFPAPATMSQTENE